MKPVYKRPSVYSSKLINGYLFIKTHKEKLFDRFVPNGETAIVFNLSGGVELIKGNKKETLPQMFIVVPYIGSMRIVTSVPCDTMVVLCKSSIFSKVFNIAMDKLPKGPHKSVNIFGGFPMWEKLKGKGKNKERFDLFESYIRQQIDPVSFEKDIIDLVYEEIIGAGCGIQIGEIIKKYNLNPRTFRRNFLSRVGINAKGLHRIVRVNRVWDKMKSNPGLGVYNLIDECNFFDQSHLINDFKKLVGESPRDFLNRDLTQVEILSAKRD